MKTKDLLLVGLVAAFSSCSTAYHTGQTPDDVYYSPAPAVQETYVATNNQSDRDSYANRNEEEQDIRRGIRDQRYRTGITLGIGYGYDPYSYSPFGYNYNPYNFNPYAYNPYAYNSFGYKGIYDPYSYDPYNNFYSPYYSGLGLGLGYGNYYGNYYGGGYYPPIYSYPAIGNINTNTGARRYNLGAYNNTGTTSNGVRNANGNYVPSNISVSPSPVRTFRPTGQIQANQGTGVGNVLRRVFTPSNSRYYTPATSNNRTYNNNSSDRSNNSERTYTPPSRSFDNTPSSTPSSSGNSGGSAPVRTFRR